MPENDGIDVGIWFSPVYGRWRLSRLKFSFTFTFLKSILQLPKTFYNVLNLKRFEYIYTDVKWIYCWLYYWILIFNIFCKKLPNWLLQKFHKKSVWSMTCKVSMERWVKNYNNNVEIVKCFRGLGFWHLLLPARRLDQSNFNIIINWEL